MGIAKTVYGSGYETSGLSVTSGSDAAYPPYFAFNVQAEIRHSCLISHNFL